ncbi:hypothetical protein GQ53DRAFT_600982, partial [Thozetella sp. PMI_491]
TAPKRQRLFISRQACERCRLKKTRCDGDTPCGQCQGVGAECIFGDRKASRNEVSLGMIFNALKRIETKVEGVRSGEPQAPTSKAKRQRSNATVAASVSEFSHSASDNDGYLDAEGDPATPKAASLPPLPLGASLAASATQYPSIPYAIRQILLWPAVRRMLRSDDQADHRFDPIYATILEQKRAALPPPGPSSVDCMAGLRISEVNALADSYFSTFNLANPILDRKLFVQHTLGTAINSDFGSNIESCVVLVVMALGSLGHQALREGGFVGASAEIPGAGGTEDGIPGLAFFNEARKRIGFLLCENSIQSCQYYLLSGLFFAHLTRPVDWWVMVNRACLCCISIPRDCDEWMLDMQSRLFWNTAMFEAVLTQDLDLPVSKLLDYEDKVPLPRFVEVPGIALAASLSAEHEERESLSQYHFLSQIAHRIILTRLRNTMFASPGSKLVELSSPDDYPPQALEDELLHQFEQWRHKLPPSLQWDNQEVIPPATTPANMLVVPWLRSRYVISRYHLRRPLFHRALHHPNSMSERDLEKCKDALARIMDWTSLTKLSLVMRNCLPLKFFICTQLFGMILIMDALGQCDVVKVKELVPAGYGAWRLFALDLLKAFAPCSPAVARDYEIV